MRVDWDPVKGAHINLNDCRSGKALAKHIAIPFERDKNTVRTIIKRLHKLKQRTIYG